MAFYKFDGVVETVFPTLGVTLKPGDVFEAVDGLDVPGLSVTKAKVTVKSSVEDVVEAVSDAPAADVTVSTSEAVDAAPVESTKN